MRKNLKQQSMMWTMRATRTYPSDQSLGFFDVELRVAWLEAKGNPLSRLEAVIDWEGFRPLPTPSSWGEEEEAARQNLRGLRRFRAIALQRGGNWFDQPDLQPGQLRIPIPNRDCHGPPPEKRRLKPETTDNPSATED